MKIENVEFENTPTLVIVRGIPPDQVSLHLQSIV